MLQLEKHGCLYPLTLFLQMVAKSLNRIHITVSSNEWCTLEPLYGMMVRRERRFKPEQDPSNRPGFVAYIMLQEKHMRFIVTSTAVNYSKLTRLRKHAVLIRNVVIDGMRSRLSHLDERCVSGHEEYSDGIKKHFEFNKRNYDERSRHPTGVPRRIESISGCTASGHTDGKYFPPCLTNEWQFKMEIPHAGREAERTYLIESRLAYPSKSCAKWEMFITILLRPDPEFLHRAYAQWPRTWRMECGKPTPSTRNYPPSSMIRS